IKAWRCDLTALSRSHNFYFVACSDIIYVYQPTFPDQWIPGEPELILHPPTSSPDLQPGIDPEDPHSITRLHVDYLGQDEIILITCDDGDVVGYRTEEIQRVLDKRAESSDDDQELKIEDSVRTFLHRNVGESAWGLAIHREARMIAISANTHKVTVIAYALAQETGSSSESCGSSDSDIEGCPDEEDPADFPSPRRQDHVITLCARHNIPAVSFNNSGDDPAGRWLSSSSINGEASIWDLHQPWEPVRVIKLGFCASVRDPAKAPRFFAPGVCDCLRPSNCPHAVWSTMFLDASTAYERTAAEDAAWDFQHLAPCFQVVNKDKGRFKIKPRKMVYPARLSPMFLATAILILHRCQQIVAWNSQSRRRPSSMLTMKIPSQMCHHKRRSAAMLTPKPQITSPLLVVTKEDVYLYQRPLDPSGDYSDPVAVMQRPLHPAEPGTPWPFIPGSHDRHCYTTQIPDLGVFIIASPNGRAGIFSLTKQNSNPAANPSYSFHLEYILPFANDADNTVCDVEGTRLVGVAAGPVQGMLDALDEGSASEEGMAGGGKPGSRWWRLLMYFTDHTVLAFELGRRRAGETPEVGELVV
ncbi:hypothetical protein EJ07DRAFT_101567, partial [Lizonia empirigonia]